LCVCVCVLQFHHLLFVCLPKIILTFLVLISKLAYTNYSQLTQLAS